MFRAGSLRRDAFIFTDDSGYEGQDAMRYGLPCTGSIAPWDDERGQKAKGHRRAVVGVRATIGGVHEWRSGQPAAFAGRMTWSR